MITNASISPVEMNKDKTNVLEIEFNYPAL